MDEIKLQEEEVEQISWMTTNEINNLIDNNKFLESHGYIFQNIVSNKSK